MLTTDELKLHLSSYELIPNSRRFVIGTHNTGITVYNQQVRALNLLYLIHKTKAVPARSTVGIIGGGAAGITAFLAGQSLGFQCWLFEEKPTLMHLQSGCDTRWLHPKIYDWPDEGTDFPYAALPILDWREDTAGQVARTLVRQFSRLANRKRVHRGANVKVTGRRIKWQNSLQNSEVNGEKDFDLVIFAVGFGIEKYVSAKSRVAISYWRNDDLNQPALGKEKKSVFVSGLGDGGLIDAIRSAIDGFHQGSLLRELFDASDRELILRLRQVRSEWFATPKKPSKTFLYDAFMKLNHEGLMDQVKQRLRDRHRTDVEVTLNGKYRSFAEALDLSKASMLNNLLAFLLHQRGTIRYKAGECRLNQRKISLGNSEEKFDQAVVRHGTDRAAVLKKVGCKEGVNFLKEHGIVTNRQIARPLWSAGWWSTFLDKNAKSKREFVPPATQLLATTFVATLSDVIRLKHTSEFKDFRITLHRLFSFNDEIVYQQICRYVGTRTNGKVGRVFPLDVGLVGYACQAGIPAIFVRRDDSLEALEALALSKIGSIPMSSVLAIPFRTSTSDASATYVNLILFLDSSNPKFFEESKGREILEIVYTSCEGFVQNVESMKSNNEIYFSPITFPAQPCDRNAFASLRATADKYDSLYLEEDVFSDKGSQLQFTTIDAFHADFVRDGASHFG